MCRKGTTLTDPAYAHREIRKKKYNANGAPSTNRLRHQTAKEQDILDAVTVTETKGGPVIGSSCFQNADKIQQKGKRNHS